MIFIHVAVTVLICVLYRVPSFSYHRDDMQIIIGRIPDVYKNVEVCSSLCTLVQQLYIPSVMTSYKTTGRY